MSETLIKKATAAIETLSKERDTLEEEVFNLQEKVAHLKSCADITLKFLKLGHFPIEEFSEKFNEFSNKSADDLKTFEKAAELMSNKSFNLSPSLGSLSEEIETGFTPEDRFLARLLD